MGSRNFKYKIISFSVDRNTHEKKKEWLASQGFFYGDYDLKHAANGPSWPGLNFCWCFEKQEEALVFKLRWGDYK